MSKELKDIFVCDKCGNVANIKFAVLQIKNQAKEKIRNKLLKEVLKVSDLKDETTINKEDWNNFWQKELGE